MLQRKRVWKILKKAGVLDSDDSRIKEFVQFFHENPEKCWEEIVPQFRKKFYDCFDAVVPPLLEVDDTLIRTLFINYADLKKPKERALLGKIAEQIDPSQDPVSIKRLAKLNSTAINKVLSRRSLPDELQKYLKKKGAEPKKVSAKK
ncbi:MAG: hypothetical protein O7C75_11460 [Verrucomicrobia bacterium]|nr:hypothetical protein [Verrucomicrobiota bacterium]